MSTKISVFFGGRYVLLEKNIVKPYIKKMKHPREGI